MTDDLSRVVWAEAARPALLEAAGRYRALVTYKQLAAAVQESTGVTTTQPVHQWIGDVLGRVTDDCQSRGEPLLSSLCVSVQGSVGQGYADAVEHARGSARPIPTSTPPTNAWSAIATGRPPDSPGTAAPRYAPPTSSRCADPLRPSLLLAERRNLPRRPPAQTVPPRAAPAVEPAARLCPTCFTEMPASGVCDYCD